MEPTEDDLIARVEQGSLDPASALPGGEEPARFAIRRLMPRLLQAMLQAGLDPNACHELDEPLLNEAIQMWQASRHGWAAEAVPAMIDALIRAGADVGAQGTSQYTALHVAAHCAGRDICQQLIEAGADPGAIAEPSDPEGGETPYEVADRSGRRDIADFIRSFIPPAQLERRPEQKAAARTRYLRSIPGRRN